jgi:nucleoside-diphosphate-sugar epimerase
MKILIVGGTGFIGSYLYNHLTKLNYLVHFTSRKSKFGIKYDASTMNLSDVVCERYNIVINNINPQNLNYNISIKNDESIIDYCKKNNSFLIHISSLFATEKNRNANSYSLKKAFSEEIIRQELNESKYTILRFTQVFDYNGKSIISQKGLHYLFECVKYNRPISMFSNYKDCYRNYLSIDVLVNMISVVIENKITGVLNAHIDSFTMSFLDLIKTITSLNPNYNKNFINIGDNIGLAYAIESESKQLISKLSYKKPLDYFKEAYDNLSE